MDNTMCSDEKCSTATLLYKIVNDEYLMLSEDGKIKNGCKYNINIPELKIQNSKFIGKPEDKFETLLFLPPNPQRIAEGGLRTKGLFKFSYKLVDNQWHVCDLEGNPLIPAPKEIQEKINEYVNGLEDSDKRAITQLPLITVITVVYNGAKHLEETIKSVLNQTYPNVEYIIIDGSSTDGTLDIIKKYEDKIDYWVSEPDEGIYDAMNKGITVAFGQWLNMLNSGDLYYDSLVVEKIMMKKLDTSIYGIAGKWIFEYMGETFLCHPNPYQMLKKPGWHINHQAFFYKTSAHKILGLYDTNLKYVGDDDFYLRFLTNNLKISTDEIIMIKFDFSKNTSDSIHAKVENFALRIRYLGLKPKEIIYGGSTIIKHIARKFLEVFGMQKLVLFYRKRRTLK